MKKIFVLTALLATTFVSAQETGQEKEQKIVKVEETFLGCDCDNHKEGIIEETKEVSNQSSVILACGSSGCTHDKEKK